MIEWRFGLAPLTVRDKNARNLAEVLDFAHPPNLTAPLWTVPSAAPGSCQLGGTADYEEWKRLAALAISKGWKLP
jgi:phospholipase C